MYQTDKQVKMIYSAGLSLHLVMLSRQVLTVIKVCIKTQRAHHIEGGPLAYKGKRKSWRYLCTEWASEL